MLQKRGTKIMANTGFATLNNLINLPLTQETCQMIHYEALRNMSKVKEFDKDLDMSFYDYLHQKTIRSGPELYLLHPEEIKEIFQNVTIDVYRFIEELFCSRENRTISMTAKIIERFHRDNGLRPISPLAIWAVCMYLIRKRTMKTNVTMCLDGDWYISRLNWNINVTGSTNESYQASAVVVSCPEREQVLSIEIAGRESVQEKVSLAIYEALLCKRNPSSDGAAGMVWGLPRRIFSNFEPAEGVRAFLSKTDIGWYATSSIPNILEVIQGDWETNLMGRKLSVRNLQLIVDRFLFRELGYSPQRTQTLLEETHKNSVGLKRDPLWQFPDLRYLVKKQPAEVNGNGIVQVERLRYTHVFLRHWKNENVEVIISPTDRNSAWVYEPGGDLICQAMRCGRN